MYSTLHPYYDLFGCFNVRFTPYSVLTFTIFIPWGLGVICRVIIRQVGVYTGNSFVVQPCIIFFFCCPVFALSPRHSLSRFVEHYSHIYFLAFDSNFLFFFLYLVVLSKTCVGIIKSDFRLHSQYLLLSSYVIT